MRKQLPSIYAEIAQGHRKQREGSPTLQVQRTQPADRTDNKLVVPRRPNGEIAVRTADELDNLKESDCFGRFSKWAECSSTCGQGTRERTFKVLKKAERGGSACELPDGFVEVKKCGDDQCFDFQSCELQGSSSSFKSLGVVEEMGTRIFTNETDLLVVVPPQQNPQGNFPRLLLWKRWDAVPPTSGELPTPENDDVDDNLHNSALGSDHMAPLAGYYNRMSFGSENMLLTTSDMKNWRHQPRPKPPKVWAQRQASMIFYGNLTNSTYQYAEISPTGTASESNEESADHTAIAKSTAMHVHCQPGLITSGDGSAFQSPLRDCVVCLLNLCMTPFQCRPRHLTDVLAAKLWHRVHAKCWDLVGPMLNFSRHTAVVGQPWTFGDNQINDTEENAAAPGFVSAEFMLVRLTS